MVNAYGEPDGLHENVVLGKRNITVVYDTGINAKSAGANASFTYADNKLVSKTQTKISGGSEKNYAKARRTYKRIKKQKTRTYF